jgi:membrane-anchored protein YejM (alkaline phosphatase superfamily)
MNAQDFFKLVEQMRQAQKHYFAYIAYERRSNEPNDKSTMWLETSKDLESKVDAEIKRVNKVLAEREKERAQPKLNF